MTTRLRSVNAAAVPFSSDAESLDSELRWLKTRVSRIVEERHLLDAQEEEADGDPAYVRRPGRVDSREARCRVVELRETEKRLRNEIDDRLQCNRGQRGAPTLGLDELCKEHDLSAEERLVLLVCLPLGISQRVAEGTLGELLQHWGSIAVSDAIAVLDPNNISDWLRLRRLFRPPNAPLVSHGLIEVSKHSGEPGPDTLPSADVRLTLDAFAKITGDPDALTEGD